MQLRATCAFLLFFLIATGTGAWAADGRILDLAGDVRVNGKPISVDTELHRKDTIVAGVGASVRILLADNSVLDLESETQIVLSDYSYQPAASNQNISNVGIVEGSLRYVSGLIAKDNPERVSFKAGNATIGVRGSFTSISIATTGVGVAAMIGEATLEREGRQIIVPTGQTARTDPVTGAVSVLPTTTVDKVNAIVRAIAAISPDAGDPEDEGCSRGENPLRREANPDVTAADMARIKQLLGNDQLTEGDLIMVIVVMSNNAEQLCIDAVTIASAINLIANVNPDAVARLVDVADMLNPGASGLFYDANNPTDSVPDPDDGSSVDPEIPPGGTPRPSPE
ncbi:MAG: FecR domain-containing protein [Halioglobus sp.]|nr:FecR domain-containing protein [Halioglobus sp.]